jgi:predicted phosphodiesterase
MRYLVISDIHSNLPALEAVLNDAPRCEAVVCLGDIVGYGPDPNACVDRLMELEPICLAGNHDWGAIGQADLTIFNRDARQALVWTQDELTASRVAFLQSLSPREWLSETVLLSHGSPRDPVWEYLVDTSLALHNFVEVAFDIALVGHSHLPLIFQWQEEERRAQSHRAELGTWIRLDSTRRFILNPGSVGQPRDGDPRASYALLDTDEMAWCFRRVEYPVEITQERMRAKMLPQRLIDRLEIGR